MRRTTSALAGLITLCGLSSAAFATVAQPNGLVVPRDSANGEVQIYTMLQTREPGVNWQTDSNTTPEVFSPLCDFTAELVLRQTGSNLAVGWYNVDPARTVAPALTEIYQVIPKSSPVGTKITGATIRGDTRYKGGLIGFALMSDGSFTSKFTEKKWNTICTSCTPQGPWIHSVTYISKATANGFYVAFEDGNPTGSSFNNDGDYNDYVFFFTGLTCQGGGQQCDIPTSKGACRSGVTECLGTGGTTCKPLVQPGQNTEKCDGVDNDCNGIVDDNAPCPANQLCSKGHCADPCGSEVLCPVGQSCELGRCIDTACVGKTCPVTQVCRAGGCVDPCDGIKCPGVTVCSGGVCVDPCASVTCPSGKVCQNGACVQGCDCAPCGSGQACQTSTNKCVSQGCQTMTCGAGDICQNGACVAACTGAVCPSGQACSQGVCQDLPPDTSGGGGSDGGTTEQPPTDGGTIATGCGCRITPSPDRQGLAACVAAFAMLALTARRRITARRRK
ncbi:MAG: MopE-related protein [Polyangia bacterium]